MVTPDRGCFRGRDTPRKEDEMTTFKKVKLVTEYDIKGNEYGFIDVDGDWYNTYENKVTERYMREVIFSTVIIARFGDVELSGDQWRNLQCPIRMTQEQLNAVLANQPAAVTAYEAEFMDGFSDPRTPEEKAADAFNDEYSNDATISDIRTGFQQW